VLEQFWAPTDATSVFLGLNFATAIASECAAPPCSGGRRDYLYGADLYLNAAAGRRRRARERDVSTEYFARTIAGAGHTEGALYTEPVLQVAKRCTSRARRLDRPARRRLRPRATAWPGR